MPVHTTHTHTRACRHTHSELCKVTDMYIFSYLEDLCLHTTYLYKSNGTIIVTIQCTCTAGSPVLLSLNVSVLDSQFDAE